MKGLTPEAAQLRVVLNLTLPARENGNVLISVSLALIG